MQNLWESDENCWKFSSLWDGDIFDFLSCSKWLQLEKDMIWKKKKFDSNLKWSTNFNYLKDVRLCYVSCAKKKKRFFVFFRYNDWCFWDADVHLKCEGFTKRRIILNWIRTKKTPNQFSTISSSLCFFAYLFNAEHSRCSPNEWEDKTMRNVCFI